MGASCELLTGLIRAAVIGLCLLVPATALAEEEVRIAIVSGEPKIALAGKQLALFDADTGDRIASGSCTVVPAKGSVLAGKTKVKRLLAEAVGGVHVGSGVYLGRVEIEAEGGGLSAINRLPLETYLLGIVGSEMSPEWPLEALKAQAVAARTYAMQRRMMMRAANRSYDLESSVISQVYKGAEKIRPAVIQAVKATRGEVMSYRHGLAEALFHSTCGGKTSSAEAAFGRPVPYLVSEPCRWCRESTRHSWKVSVSLHDLSQMLESARITRTKLKSFERKDGASAVSVHEKNGAKAVSPRAIRQAMGYTVLYSEHFTAKTKGSTVQIQGSGFGHGVGMCQWGARGLALEGKGYQEILEHYYKGIRVQRIY
jgi:stage II sporulation protein D